MENSGIIDENKQKFKDIYIKSIEEKILNHFVFLKDENKLNKFYSEFDIEDEDKMIINMWEEIINFIYEEIFNCMFLTISDLKQYTKIKDKFPSGLDKIIQYLIYNKKYITDKDLKNENFYISNFPNLYSKKGYLSSILNFFPNFNSCKSGNNNNDNSNNDELELDEETPVRKDLGNNYLSEKISENFKVINYKIFKNHCNAILFTLNDILSEEGEDIIIKDKLIDIMKKKYINTNLENGKFKLLYGMQLINEVLFYLKQTKQIIIFKINESKNIEFIKVCKNKADIESEVDKKTAENLLEEYYNNIKNL
jgi:hypothetical protein